MRETRDIRTARSGDGLIILDIEGDSYHAVYTPVGGTGPILLPAAIAPAVRRRLAAHDRFDIEGNYAWQDLALCTNVAVRLADLVRFIGCLFVAAWRFRTRNFQELIKVASQRRIVASASHVRAYGELVPLFDRLCLFLPFRIECLFRSFFLLHFLRAHGRDAQWVFGATLFPFRAHCWLAQGPVLLGDRSDNVLDYTTMMVAGTTQP
jgi:hypothetical protein